MTSESRTILDVQALLAQAGGQHLLGSLASTDLNVNLLAFTGSDGIDEHVNNEVDVLIVALDGAGVLTVDGEASIMSPGQLTIVPKGASRSIRAKGGRFAYLTCHGRRRGLMPSVRNAADS
jgi:quercetin dioxygenase-like cupin family protein